MWYFQVRYDSRVVIYDHRGFIRLATGHTFRHENTSCSVRVYRTYSPAYTRCIMMSCRYLNLQKAMSKLDRLVASNSSDLRFESRPSVP